MQRLLLNALVVLVYALLAVPVLYLIIVALGFLSGVKTALLFLIPLALVALPGEEVMALVQRNGVWYVDELSWPPSR